MTGYIDTWRSDWREEFFGSDYKEKQLLENLTSAITDYTRALKEIRVYAREVGNQSVDELMQRVFKAPLQDGATCLNQLMDVAAAYIKREDSRRNAKVVAETVCFDDDDHDDFCLDDWDSYPLGNSGNTSPIEVPTSRRFSFKLSSRVG